MPAKLIFIENPYDVRSNQLKEQLVEAHREGRLQEEAHFIPFDQIHGLPIQAAPCAFLLGTDELLQDFTGEDVLAYLRHMIDKALTEQVIADMTELLKEGGII